MRITTRTARTTSNPEASALIRQAESKCQGCRTDWRLRPTDETKQTYVHRGNVACTAPQERQRLREIAGRKAP